MAKNVEGSNIGGIPFLPIIVIAPFDLRPFLPNLKMNVLQMSEWS